MKTVYLLRHAKSSWEDPALADIDRPLNKRGRHAAEAIARHAAATGIRPAQILCSPAKRTRETLDALQAVLGTSIPTRFEKQIYLAEATTLIRRLQRISDALETVMLIGHNPGLAELACALVDGSEPSAQQALAKGLPTGALASIVADIEHWADLRAGCGRLAALVRPKDLSRNGGAPGAEDRPADPL